MANSEDSVHIPPIGPQTVPMGAAPPHDHDHIADFERILHVLLRVDPDVRLFFGPRGEIRATCASGKADAVEAALKTALTIKPFCPVCAAEFDQREKNVRRSVFRGLENG
jgi:hypothetical protein